MPGGLARRKLIWANPCVSGAKLVFGRRKLTTTTKKKKNRHILELYIWPLEKKEPNLQSKCWFVVSFTHLFGHKNQGGLLFEESSMGGFLVGRNRKFGTWSDGFLTVADEIAYFMLPGNNVDFLIFIPKLGEEIPGWLLCSFDEVETND